ncbi:MAG TPA: N-acetyltransferase [Gammaproteobacteria bacterium]|nr:N-acetyltransferase [Gammaproteobacteria bacterium]
MLDSLEFEFKIKPTTDSELNHYVVEFCGEALYWDDERGEDRDIGVIRGVRVDIARVRMDELDPGEIMDSISPDISDFRETVFDQGVCYLPRLNEGLSCDKPRCGGLVYISEVKVEPEFRGQGIGGELMRRMSELIDIEYCLIGLKAFPLSDDYGRARDEVEIQRVKHFYEKLGFEHAGKDFMLKDASQCHVMQKRLKAREALQNHQV